MTETSRVRLAGDDPYMQYDSRHITVQDAACLPQ
jgi:hypothetical protein